MKTNVGTISIHALRGEGDLVLMLSGLKQMIFQSTPSVGRATKYSINSRPAGGISIHALRGEGDEKRAGQAFLYLDFNPRPPWGGRLQAKERYFL